MKAWIFTPMALLLILLGCEDRPAGDPEACLNQMIALEKAQDYAAVVEKATACLCIPGIDSSWVLEMRGFAFFRQGDFIAHLKDDFRITQLAHARCIRKTSAWEEIGNSLEVNFQNYPMALWAWEQGVIYAKACGQPWKGNYSRNFRGMLYADMGRFAEAQKEYDLILASGDTSMTQTALNNRMSLHHRSHDHRSCVQTGRALQAISPLKDFQSFWMASAFDSLGQRDSACLYYRRAAALGHPEAATVAAKCLKADE